MGIIMWMLHFFEGGGCRARVAMKLKERYSTPAEADNIFNSTSSTEGSDSSCHVIEKIETAKFFGSSNLLWVGDVYVYTIPSFEVLSFDLRHVEISENCVKIDAFMRNDPTIITIQHFG